MITTGDLRKNLVILLDGDLQKILDYAHNKQGRGSAVIRIQFRNLRSGANTERTFQAGERFEDVRLERVTAQYMYEDGDDRIFMNTDTYDQFPLSEKILGDTVDYIRENDSVDVLFYGEEPIDVELPTSVNLRVTQTDPGLKGDTATGGKKTATLETGLVVQVPLFINEGDTLKIDTRTGDYLTRV